MGTVLMVYNGTADAEELGEQGKYTDYAEQIMKRTQQLEEVHKKTASDNSLARTDAAGHK